MIKQLKDDLNQKGGEDNQYCENSTDARSVDKNLCPQPNHEN